MNHLDKAGIVQKLTPYGVSSWAGVARLIREQGLPAKYLTPRKPFFDENEVNLWLERRASGRVLSATIRSKIIKHKRKEKKEREAESKAETKETWGAAAAAFVPTAKKEGTNA
jgi:hypothetical protein